MPHEPPVQPPALFRFSLRRLFINLTVLCAIVAAAIGFPAFARAVALILLEISPFFVIAPIACYFSKHKWETLLIVAGGAFLGMLLAPQRHVNWSGIPSWWDVYRNDLEVIAPAVGRGALLFAIMDFALRKWFGRKESKVTNGEIQ